MGALFSFRPVVMSSPESCQQSITLTVEHAFSRACDHAQAGQLLDAARFYRAILDAQPDHVEARRNLDEMEMRVAADAFSGGRYAEAEMLGKSLTTQSSTESFGWKLLGTLYGRIGRREDALQSLRRAVVLTPLDYEAHNSLGSVLLDMRQLEAAQESCLRAVELRPDHAEAHNNLGIILNELGQFEAALSSCHRALSIRQDFAEAHNTLGFVLNSLGRFDEAIASCGRVLALGTDFPQAHLNIGNALKGLGRFNEAIDSYRRVIEIAPDCAEAYFNLGSALRGLWQLDEAIDSYRQAIEVAPDYADAHSSLAISLRAAGHLDAALTSSRRALEIKPDFHRETLNLGMILLGLGRYREGWACYEARSVLDDQKLVVAPDLPFPLWRGESLEGKSLLIYPEQGAGDYVHFVRYAPLLKERGVSRLTVRCAPPLKDLLATAAGIDEVITDADPVPPHDYWSFPLSLPLHFDTTIEAIPAVLPYLRSLPNRRDRWGERLPAEGFTVGLVWKGYRRNSNDHNRSIPGLEALAPLWSVPGITFVSLQKGQGEDEACSTELPIIHLGSDIQDFADTAAIVDHLDLVICVDTAIAHIAGALGKPCWVLLPAIGCDWRWMRDRSDSPWYPGALRLFRQKQRGDWSAVVDEVANTLREFMR